MANTRGSSWTWRVGSIAGIAIRVHVLLVVLLAWIAMAYAVRGSGMAAAAIGIALVVAVLGFFVIAPVVWVGASSTLTGVPVSAAILRRVGSVSPEQRLEDAAALLLGGGQNQVPVVDHGRAVSVLTRADVASGLATGGPTAAVSTAPSHEVVTVEPSDAMDVVLDRLREHPRAVAVVIDHGLPVGLITAESLASYAAQHERHAA